ncbi:MAG: hypothetical protein ACOX7I_01705 [Oscillospiraceae bacterium]|jgi:putative membrane protein
MKKQVLSVIVLFLSLSLILGLTGSAAESASASKEEVIYARLDFQGEATGAYVVNSFELSRAGQVTDYGDYTAVINLSTTEKLDYKDGKVSFYAPAGRFYYQGELKSIRLPWEIGIEYYLDGKPVKPEELAGKSGHLEIAISVRENRQAAEGFFESFALNITVTLDADLCYEIEAEGGAIASAGGDRVITFTLLPGSEGDFSVAARVRDFEMDAIQFTGLPLNISVGINSSELEEMTGGLKGLSDGISAASEGAVNLSGGARELDFAAGELRSGMNSMQAGMSEMLEGLSRLKDEGGALSAGTAALSEGIASILAGLEGFSVTSADLTELALASTGIKTGLDALSAGLAQLQAGFQSYRDTVSESGQDPSAIAAANGNTAAALRGTVEELSGRLAALEPGTQEYVSVSAQIEQANQIIRLLEANSSLIGAQQQFIDSLKAGVGSLAASSGELAEGYAGLDNALQSLPVLLSRLTDGFEQLESGLKELEAGARQLGNGIDKYAAAVASIAEGYKTLHDGFVRLSGGCGLLKEGLSGLSRGAAELSDGLATLKNETSGIDVRVQEGIDDFLAGYKGEELGNVSFVSEKNKNIQSVQFVMMTPSIREEVEELPQPPAEDKGFLERLLALFGL